MSRAADVVLFATREAEGGNARVKRMSDGEQFDVPIGDLFEWLAGRVGRVSADPAAGSGLGTGASADRLKQLDVLLDRVRDMDADVIEAFVASSDKLIDSLEAVRGK